VPTRHRNHNGYFLQWGDQGFLFDPGEGIQRQMTLCGVAMSQVHHVCISHFHGDHCLGLPGVLQRASLDRLPHPLDVHFPASGAPYFERLRHASIYQERAEVRPRPIEAPGLLAHGPDWRLLCLPLSHTAPAWGFRVEEPPGWWIDPVRVRAAGLPGPLVGALRRQGWVEHGGRRWELPELAEPRPGQSVAVVMDTRRCPAAVELARGVDLLLIESTYLASEAAEAEERGHLTAGAAAEIAREAGARSLVLSHFSQRHPEVAPFVEEAAAVYGGPVHAAVDGDRIELPPRAHRRPAAR
jgi:ribonuclease Z